MSKCFVPAALLGLWLSTSLTGCGLMLTCGAINAAALASALPSASPSPQPTK